MWMPISLALALVFSTSAAMAGEFDGQWAGTAEVSFDTELMHCPLFAPVVIKQTDIAFAISGVDYDCGDGLSFSTDPFTFDLNGSQVLTDGKVIGTVANGKFDAMAEVGGLPTEWHLALGTDNTLTYDVSATQEGTTLSVKHALKR